MRRHRLTLLAVAGVVTALACGENGLGPDRSGSSLKPGGASRRVFPITAEVNAPEIYRFDITPEGGTITLGDRFTLSFPANAVCDPTSSSYGVGHWDEACTATDRTISVTAKIWVSETRFMVDFSPSIRFTPASNVTIATDLLAPVLAGRLDLATIPGVLGKFEMQFSSDLGRSRFRDALDDPSVKTHIDLTTGRVWRRIKHFSGYVTTYGEPCIPAYEGDPNCTWVDDDGVTRDQ
jgi:hypothetical protein